MVILNALLGLILKVQMAYVCVFDLYYFIRDLRYLNIKTASFVVPFFKTCSRELTCSLVEKFGGLLYLSSFSLYLAFYYHFDNNFKSSFFKIFKRSKKNNSQKMYT